MKYHTKEQFGYRSYQTFLLSELRSLQVSEPTRGCYHRSFTIVSSPSRHVTTPTLPLMKTSGSLRTVNVAIGTERIAPAVNGTANDHSRPPRISM